MGRAQKRRPSLLGTLGLALFVLALVLLYWYAPSLPGVTSDYSQRAFDLMGLGLVIPGFLLLLLLILWRLGGLVLYSLYRWGARLSLTQAPPTLEER